MRNLEGIEEMKEGLEGFKEAKKALEDFEEMMKLVRKYPLNPDYFQKPDEKWGSYDSKSLNY